MATAQAVRLYKDGEDETQAVGRGVFSDGVTSCPGRRPVVRLYMDGLDEGFGVGQEVIFRLTQPLIVTKMKKAGRERLQDVGKLVKETKHKNGEGSETCRTKQT